MKELNSYLYFMWNHWNPEKCKEIFGDTYDADYIFNKVWCENAKFHSDTFWAMLDGTARTLLYNYCVEFMKDRI